jgi:N utilization substance protein B
MRLAVYEMLFCEDIPFSVSINEAIELTKKFDDPKAKAFVNGVLNSVKNELEAQNIAKND